MRKRLLFVSFALLLLCLCSCELITEVQYGKPAYTKINLLVYGNDYSVTKYNGKEIKLNYTVNDATQVGLALEALASKSGIECEATYVTGKNYTKKGGYSTIQNVPESKSDHDTTKAHFRILMNDLANRSADSELTIIYFSCHGFNNSIFAEKKEYGSKSSTSFAMCANSSANETLEFYTHDEFKSDLAKVKGTKVVFADVCYSGGLIEPSNVAVNPSEYTDIDATTLFWNYQVNQDPNTFYLSACRYYEQSYEPLREHGVFTAVFLDALGWDEEAQKIATPAALGSDGHTLTFFSIAQYAVQNTKSSSTYPQNPMLSNASNDVILFNII